MMMYKYKRILCDNIISPSPDLVFLQELAVSVDIDDDWAVL